MRAFPAHVSLMALQALVGLVSRTRGFTARSFQSLNTNVLLKQHNGSLKVSSRLTSSRSFGRQSIRALSAKSPDEDDSSDEQAKKLAAAFDDLAKKDGFDSTMSRMAEAATFEDDFGEDDADEDDFMDGDFSDLDFEDDDDDDDNDSEFPDFFGGKDDDMDDRIAQAKRDMVTGQVTVPKHLDGFAKGATDADLQKLGFEKETESYDNDEGSKKKVTLITNAMTCPACGSDFQSRDEHKPGYLPKDKFDIQVKLAQVEEMQQLKEKAGSSNEWSPEDEIEYLIQTSGKGDLDENDEPTDLEDIDVESLAEELELDLEELSGKKTICKRCHGLQNSGRIDDSLRPGWTDEPTLSQEQFKELLRPISEKPAVVIALIDLFDFGGSVLRELDGIAGENPVILAANKADLMPSQMGKNRIENWVRRELEYMGVQSLANIGGAVRLVSCKTGDGIASMMDKAKELADSIGGDIYIVGAANAGKSTLVNYILSRDNKEEKPVGNKPKKLRAGNRNKMKGALTTSPLPGTTLKFIKIDLGDGMNIYDTPGLLVPGTITQLLTPDELKVVCPKK